jgi:hypothetical protein
MGKLIYSKRATRALWFANGYGKLDIDHLRLGVKTIFMVMRGAACDELPYVIAPNRSALNVTNFPFKSR